MQKKDSTVISNVGTVFEVALTDIQSHEDQPRKAYDDEFIAELAKSIQEYGLLQPIGVMPNNDDLEGYRVVYGESRFRAHKQLGLEKIKATLVTGDPLAVSLIENAQRNDLKPVEQADAVRALIEERSFRHEDVGIILGKSRANISQLVAISKLPEEIKHHCSTSNICKSALIELAMMPDEQKPQAFDAIKKGATVKQARQLKRGTPRPKKDSLLSLGSRFKEKLEKVSTGDLPESELIDLIGLATEIFDHLKLLGGGDISLDDPRSFYES